MKSEKLPSGKISIVAAAAQIADQWQGRRAVDLLRQWIENLTPEQWEAKESEFVHRLAAYEINAAVHKQNRRIAGKSEEPGKKGIDTKKHKVSENGQTVPRSTKQGKEAAWSEIGIGGWMGYRFGGMVLHSMTRMDLLEKSRESRRQASGSLCVAIWFEKIAKGLPDDNKTVGDSFTNARLGRLHKMAEKEAAKLTV